MPFDDVGRSRKFLSHGFSERAGSDSMDDPKLMPPFGHGKIERRGEFVEGFLDSMSAQVRFRNSAEFEGRRS